MRRLSCTLILLAFASTGLAAERFGLAQSRTDFTLVRDSSELLQQPNVLTELRHGDRVVTTTAPVRVQGSNGSSLHISSESIVSFTPEGQVILESGSIANASEAGAPSASVYNDFTLTPSGEERLLYLARVEEDGSLTIQAVEGDLTVTDAEGEQVAFVAEGDTMSLAQDLDRWRPAAAGVGAPTMIRPAGIFRMQVDNGDGVSDEQPRRRAFWWLFTAPAAGIAAGTAALIGGYYIYDNYIDDDDDDDREEPRGPQSPITPGFNPPPSR